MRELIELGFQKVIEKDVSAAVQICVRIARQKQDPYAIAFFICLQEHADEEAQRHFLKDVQHLYEIDAAAKIFELGHGRSVKIATIPDNLLKALGVTDSKRNLLRVGSNLIDEEISLVSKTIEANRPPSGMTPVDTAVFFDESKALTNVLLTKISALNLIKSRILTACSEFLSQIELQLNSELGMAQSFVNAQDKIASFLRATTESGFVQFSSALQSVKPTNGEHLAAGMTHLRRCLKSVADVVYPPIAGDSALSDDKYLNRLSKFLTDTTETHGFRSPIDLPAAEGLLRRLNDRASKGVHDNVTYFEAQQIVIAAVLYLMNISTAWETRQAAL